MSNILIVFYSRSGVTERLALALAQGAEAAGATVRIRRARELIPREVMDGIPGWSASADAMNARHAAPTTDDAEWADGIAFGTPTRFGSVSSELKAYIDGLGGLWYQGKLLNKAGGAFSSSSTTHGGNEVTVMSLFAPMAHLGMVIVPNGYHDRANFIAGTPYGSSAVAKSSSDGPSPDEIAVAEKQGAHLTRIAGALRAVRSP